MQISSSSFHLAKKKETLTELCELNSDWIYKKLFNKTGIETRHITTENETAESLAFEAGKKCLKHIDINKIDGIIYVTQSPESTIPTRACLLQNKLKLSPNVLAFDINQGCSGFTYALSVATSLIKNNNLNKILIICSDTYSKYIPINDRTSRPIFSDGAGAVIIDSETEGEIGPFVFGTDGSGAEFLTLQKHSEQPHLYMNGPEVLKFTMRIIPTAVKNLLEKSNLKMEDISLFIFHQASAVVLKKLQNKLKINDARWFYDIKDYGNTVSATIPIAINIALNDGRIKKNTTVMLMGFGVGLSHSGCILRF